MVAYESSQWHDLFAVGAESAATLVGLLFVAVSINLKQIFDAPFLPALAARALGNHPICIGAFNFAALLRADTPTARR